MQKTIDYIYKSNQFKPFYNSIIQNMSLCMNNKDSRYSTGTLASSDTYMSNPIS